MATVNLDAEPRTTSGKGFARKLRSQGQIPAVIYGHGRDPQPLSLNARDLDKLLEHIVAESTVIEVDVTNLVVGDSLHVSDISVPEGVEVLDDPEGSVCVCAAPRAVIEAAAAPEAVEGEAGAAAAEPEVIGRGKGDE